MPPHEFEEGKERVIMISVSAKWKEAYPDASFGVLVIEGVQNGKWNRQLDTKRELLEERIRTQYSGKSKKEIRAEPLFAEYQRYFRKFGQNYPVLLQLETVALKGRPIRSPSPLVASMFMAELESGLLTAGHDFDSLETPLHLAIAEGEERYVTMDGTERILKKGDMFFSDQKGVLSSVLYGPDNRSMITKDTSRVLFTVYGHPLSKERDILNHLEEIEKTVRVFSPDAHRLDFYSLPQ